MEDDLKWNGEMILSDVLDNVLKNLNARDLCRSAQVCKSWNHAVKLEFSRRRPERILMPNPYNPILKDSEFSVANIFSVKPSVVILFCGPGPHFRSNLYLEDHILETYNCRLPYWTKLIVVGVDKALRDATEIPSCSTRRFDKSRIFNILGLALPNSRNVKIEAAYCESNDSKTCFLAKRVVRKLMLEISDQKSVLIMFGRSYYSVSNEVLKIIKKSCKSRTYTLWGGTTENYLKIINCGDGEFPNYKGMQGVICLKITGQCFEAHSTVLSCTLKITEIFNKLLEFRNKLKFRRYKLGLVCASGLLLGSEELMRMIKMVFLGISFTSFFNERGHIFGLDSMSEDPNQELMHEKALSIMILTYD